MPYTESRLPFNGSTVQSRHASHTGAEDAKGRALTQTIRLLRLLKDHPDGLTDREAADMLMLERSTINARRAELVKADLVYAGGFRRGETGIKNVCWKAR
jgi:hypothetical protein